jgi:hypothetical protein
VFNAELEHFKENIEKGEQHGQSKAVGWHPYYSAGYSFGRQIMGAINAPVYDPCANRLPEKLASRSPISQV